MGKENEVKIDQVRMAAEKIARDKSCTTEEVTVKEVKNLIERGSDGYIAAHLQTVKQEVARANCLDDKHLSAQFMAALYDLINLHKTNAEDIVRQETSITEQTVKEVCELNDQLTDELSLLKLEMEKRNQELVDQNRKLEIELETSRRTIMNNETIKQQLENKLADAETKLRDGLEELGGLRVRIDRAESEKTDAFAARDDLQKDLYRAREELEKSLKAAASEAQRADLLDKENQRQASEIGELKRDLLKAIERAATAKTRLEILATKEDKPSPAGNGRSSRSTK